MKRDRRATCTLLHIILGAVFLGAPGARAEAFAQAAAPAGGGLVTVVPGAEYEAGAITRKLFGSNWRDVWVTPVDVPVLDLGRHSGGLKPVRSGGGMQSRTLHLQEIAGWREHVFRSVNKFPVGQAMPAAIRGTTLGNIIKNNVSSLFPAGSLMVPPLLQAVGVLHVKPELYLMPDDPRLLAWQDTFALMLGALELSPQDAPEEEPGFAGSRKLRGGEEFLEDVESSRVHRLDEREFMAVRLIDFLINDTDRSTDNIRFARFGDSTAYRWRPVPRDRDRAFIDVGGWVFKFLVRPVYPKLIEFGPEYSFDGLIFESHDLDRRLLQRLTRSDVAAVAKRVQTAIDDRAIEAAIAAMPSRWRSQTNADERLRTNLRSRRDRLPDVAQEFYAWLASEVDIHGTDDDEAVVVDRHSDGRVTVTVRGREDSSSVEPFSRRTFLPSETNEVRVYLHDGDDVATVRGSESDAIVVRIIGGGGDDMLADSAGGANRFYDESGDNEFVTTGDTRVSVQEWNPPAQGAGVKFDAPWRPDWGSSSGWAPTVGYADGAGLIIGAGPRFSSHGFRRLPYHWSAGANLLLGLGNGRPGVSVNADYRAENSGLALTLDARATQFENFRFYGFGNDTPDERADRARVRQDVIAVEPSLVWHIGWRSRENLGGGLGGSGDVMPGLQPLVGKLEAGPVVYWTRADPAPNSPFSAESGQESDELGRAGFRVGLELDRTGHASPSERGWRFEADLAGYPPLWDLTESFSTASAVGSVYVPLPGDGTHLAMRTGGAFASGPFPVQHAPALGGRETLRGYSWQRFTGESSVYGSAEVRVPVGTIPLFVRWNAGVFGLADAGRVWFEDHSEGGWHAGVGGGFWLSALGQTVSVALVRGDQNRFYIQRGMSF